jgi:long-chain acyl-CoA synthetase
MQTNLARLADEALERLGDHPNLYFEGTWYSSGELHGRATRVARGLQELGVGPGDRVVVIMANCPEVGIVYSAIWRAGGVATPVIFLVTAPELQHILSDSGAVAVVTSPELLPKVKEALDGRPLPTVVVGENFADLERYDPLPIVDRDPDELAALLYTGGTTGRSKGVRLSHANLSNAGWSSRQVSSITGLTRGITGLPLSHSFGLLVTIGGYHAPEAGTSVLQRWFEPQSFLRLAAEQRSQTTAVVPSMIAMLPARGVRPERFEVRLLGGGSAVEGGGRGVRAAGARGDRGRGVRLYRDGRAHQQHTAGGAAPWHGRQAGAQCGGSHHGP